VGSWAKRSFPLRVFRLALVPYAILAGEVVFASQAAAHINRLEMLSI